MNAAAKPRTLYDKIWDAHVVRDLGGGADLLYIDRHLVHEVTSPQAFEGLRRAGRRVRRPEATLAVADHNVPTLHRDRGIEDPVSRAQIEALRTNCADFGVPYVELEDDRQGIVHVLGPEQGFTLPGTTLVCGDSHTSTHGAFGALAFGIGTSEVEHVLATQTLRARKARNLRVRLEGRLGPGVGPKDLALGLVAGLGAAGAAGHVIEYAGRAVSALSVEGRMTLCNMSIEAGARAGLVPPDEATFAYLRDRPWAPAGPRREAALARWARLHSDPGATFDREFSLDLDGLEPQVTWGTSPDAALPIRGRVPDPGEVADPALRAAMERALDYMGLRPGIPLQGLPVHKVFIGSCTNGRIEDLRAAAAVARGRKVAERVQALVVPGSGQVRRQAEAEGLDAIFKEAGFQWREPGCSMCLAMNGDRLEPGERCASTSNRNFEGRQGRGGRTHLLSPAMAAAAALEGALTDVRRYL